MSVPSKICPAAINPCKCCINQGKSCVGVPNRVLEK